MEQKGSALESDYFLPTSKITVLINTIAKMSKNPSIECELSQVLDDFLLKLGECDRYLENGIFNMNFAEAALLIQNSADVYSKKVDLLWDIIFDYQKRLLLSEEKDGDKNKEIEKVEERKRKYKRKRKTNIEENESAKLVNSFSFGGVESVDYLNQSYETVDLSKEWQKFQTKTGSDSTNEHGVSKNFNFLPNNSIYNEDKDYIGRYNQFHSMSLIDEIFHLEKQNLLLDEHNCVTKMRIDSYVINDFLLRKSIPSNLPSEEYATELKEYVNDFFETYKHQEKEVASHSTQEPLCCSTYIQFEKHSFDSLKDKCTQDSGINDLTSQQLSCKEIVVCLEKLPFDVVRDQLRRASVADSMFDDDQVSSISDHCPSPCDSLHELKDSDTNIEKVTGTLDNRSKSCSQDSAFFEDLDDHGVGEENRPECPEIPNISSETENIDNEGQNINDDPQNVIPNEEEKSSHVKQEHVATHEDKCLGCSGVKQKISKRTSTALSSYEEEEHQKVKRKRVHTKRLTAKALAALTTGLTFENHSFEVFFSRQYKAADGEGTVCPILSESEESDEEDPPNNISDAEEECQHESPPHSDEEMSEAEDANEEIPETVDEGLPDIQHATLSPIIAENRPTSVAPNDIDLLGRTSTPHRPTTSTKDIPLSFSNTDLEHEERCRKNVREWRAFILPKLKTLDNRADFDIHEYGSRIIEPSEIGEERYFKDIVEGKSAAEVSRYFIATLQLANTYNVEIAGSIPNRVANDSFHIKTLDKTKHHELLEEYQAPSEETFKERLERVKALNRTMAVHSTHYTGPPTKKRKFVNMARKLF